MWAEYDAVHISVSFTWDMRRAEWLACQWRNVAPVTIGGPATGMRGEEFEQGKYIAPGYTITSRGCPRKCWFCSVWKRDGAIRELPIRDGWNVLDDNVLAASREHFSAVITMLSRQKRRAEFTGGLDYRLLTDWHVEQLASLKPKPVVWMAYDPGDELDGVRDAAKRLLNAGWAPRPGRQRHDILRAYVLIGFPKDCLADADQRLREMLDCGITPMAMLWRNAKGETTHEWRQFQRQWARPAIVHASP